MILSETLLNVTVIANVFLAVAIVALAPGTVAELQFRIRYIGSSADSTAVGVVGL